MQAEKAQGPVLLDLDVLSSVVGGGGGGKGPVGSWSVPASSQSGPVGSWK